MITIKPPWFTIGSEIYPFIDDYLNYICIKYMKIFDVRLAMTCLEIFTDELFESRNAILIDNKSSTIINISHSKEDGYYFLGLNLKGQITSRGILSRNDFKGLNITTLSDRFVVVFRYKESLDNFSFHWNGKWCNQFLKRY